MIGRTISHYKILEELGRGGMGVVYLAEDTKLHRRVALKFLPREFTGDAEAKERFEREARAAAALNHPNIVTIHEINEAEGQIYIAMEYVEGYTLSEKLAGEEVSRGKSMTTGDIASICAQIASALQKAHDAGIVHRDIKPSNIMVGIDGSVKILDFGLAKLKGVSTLTRESSTLGTIQYMSPEQARGDEIDHRTDIWSLGVVLYQMLAGKVPFTGEYDQAVMYAILNKEPAPILNCGDAARDELGRIALKALKRDRNARYQSAASMGSDIKDSVKGRSEEGVSSPPATETRRSKNRLFIAAAFILVVLAAFYLILVAPWREAPPGATHTSRQISFTGKAYDPAISPDGNYIAYVVGDRPCEIVIRDLGSGSKVTIVSAFLIFNLHWSPDGSTLLYSAFYGQSSGSSGVYAIPRLGGDARRILPLPWCFMTWSNDASRIAYIRVDEQTGREIHILDIETGIETSIPLEGDVGEMSYVHWSPADDVILIQSDYPNRQTFWTIRSDGSGQRIVLEREHTETGRIFYPRWSRDGSAIYYIESTLRGRYLYDLMKVPFDPRTGTIAGEPRILMKDMRIEVGGLGTFFSISADGKRLVYPDGMTSENLWLVSVEGKGADARTSARQLTHTTAMKSRARISPDGTRAVFAMGDEAAKNIYTVPLSTEDDASTQPKQITYMDALNDFPVWSPDGSEIAFISTKGNEQRIWLIDADGDRPRPLEENTVSSRVGELEWAPGNHIIYRSGGLDNFTILDPRSGDERPLIEDSVPGYIFSPCWSYNGSRVAVLWNQLHGDEQIIRAWIISVEDGSRRQLLDEISWPIGWSSDNESVYALVAARRTEGIRVERPIFRISASSGEGVLHAPLPFGIDEPEHISISADGKTIVALREEWRADIWLVENFDPEVE